MYEVYCDGKILYRPNDKDLAVINPKVSLEINNAGSFQFSMPPTHPMYDLISKFTSSIEVLNDGESIFIGRPVEESVDTFKTKYIYCEGELAYLNDSIQRPSESHDITVRGFLELMIDSHNSQVEESKQFTVGIVTVTDSNDSLYRYTNYENTLTDIKDKLVDRLGGYLMIRHDNGVRYLDYLEEIPNTCQQAIEFGNNLLDFASNIDITEIATRFVPLGAKLEESQYTSIDERVTIKSVNDGLDYVQSDEAIAAYGTVTKIGVWDDVHEPDILKTKGEDYLESIQWENMTINLTAVDLHNLDKNIESIKVGDKILAISKPHGLRKYFPVQSMNIDLLRPDQNKIQLGMANDVSISTKSNEISQTAEEAKNFPISSVLQSAIDNASEMIKSATNGYIVLHMDENGNPDELLIMDTPDISTATKVWRWNVNGLGYSNNGYNGTYGLAITMDGSIVADKITSGTMYADRIKGGSLIMGGSNNDNGVITIKNASGAEIGKWDKDGLNVSSGTIKGVTIESNNASITGGTINIQTDSSTRDVIQLKYGAYTHQISPSGMAVVDSSSDKELSATSSALGFIDTNTGKFTADISSDGGVFGSYFAAKSDGTWYTGASGSFSVSGHSITVRNGIVTSIS